MILGDTVFSKCVNFTENNCVAFNYNTDVSKTHRGVTSGVNKRRTVESLEPGVAVGSG